MAAFSGPLDACAGRKLQDKASKLWRPAGLSGGRLWLIDSTIEHGYRDTLGSRTHFPWLGPTVISPCAENRLNLIQPKQNHANYEPNVHFAQDTSKATFLGSLAALSWDEPRLPWSALPERATTKCVPTQESQFLQHGARRCATSWCCVMAAILAARSEGSFLRSGEHGSSISVEGVTWCGPDFFGPRERKLKAEA